MSDEKSEKGLTELQQKFLHYLANDAEWDYNRAKKLAGYADSVSATYIVRSLKTEILELASSTLVASTPKAVGKLVALLDNPSDAYTLNKLKVIKEVLDRAGVVSKSTDGDVNLRVPQGGLFILPAKEASVASALKGATDEEDNDSRDE